MTFPDTTCVGDDEIAAYFTAKNASIPDLRLDVVTIAAADDSGFVCWRMTGTHTGRVVGINGTGKAINLDGIDHIVLRDGMVETNTVVFDQLKFARQVGMIPEDGKLSDRLLKGAFNFKMRTFAFLKYRRRRSPAQ